MKLKTKIEHSFNIDTEEIEDLDFDISFEPKEIKKKAKIIEVKRKKSKKDGSTGLF